MSNQDRFRREAAERARQGQGAGNYTNRTYIEQATRQAEYARAAASAAAERAAAAQRAAANSRKK